jgi:hypothetical protein
VIVMGTLVIRDGEIVPGVSPGVPVRRKVAVDARR